MTSSSRLRATLAATVMLAGLGFSSAARADTCSISFTVVKAGFVVGGQGGSGTLRCGDRSYRISIGGLSYGFMIGASETRFRGTATFNGSPRNVAGVYGAGGAGAAIATADDTAHQRWPAFTSGTVTSAATVATRVAIRYSTLGA